MKKKSFLKINLKTRFFIRSYESLNGFQTIIELYKTYQQNHPIKQHDFDQYVICLNHHAQGHILLQYNNHQDQLEKDVQVQDDN